MAIAQPLAAGLYLQQAYGFIGSVLLARWDKLGIL